jgi:putative ABC transport system ATP-binding protein
VYALADVSLRIGQGEFVAVRGPSGSGKSTLLMLVGGLGRPTQGRVIVGGQDLSAATASELAQYRAANVGFVFQMFHLLPYLTVLENVLAAAPADRSADAVQRARQLLEQCGLAERVEHYPGELSTGERQRVAIARAMINNPRLILADEPTGNLDQRSGEEVLRLISQFNRDGGTVLLVTHQQWAADFAQRVVQLERGRIVGN